MVKIVLLFSFISAIILTSCSSTRQITHDQISYDSLNQELAGERCKIILVDSGFVFAEDVELTEDSTYIFKVLYSSGRWHTADTIKTQTSNVRSITYTDNGIGALEGFGFGLATGLLLAALTPAAIRDAKEEDPVGGVAAGMGMGAMALTTPIVGLMSGALIGHKYECLINASDSIPSGEVEKLNLEELSDEDKSPVKVEYNSIVKRGNGYLVIMWQGKKIHLQRSEYNYRGTTNEGKEFIIVPNYIFELKFK